MNTLEQIADLEKQYLLQTYNRYPIAFSRGKGVFLFDLEGKRYLDFVSGLGVNALGHAHPRIVKAIREQAAMLVHISNLYYHEYQGPLAEKLCKLSGLNRAFFSNSGTEAIEGSIKLARLAGHRAGGAAKSRLVALDGSYHGRTFGALSLTGQDKHRKGFEPLLEEVTFVKQNDLASLRAAISDETCAIVLEPVFGEGGIYECSVEFLQECRALADRHRAALIFDEIQCGLGRTGTMFAFQSFGVTPDIVAIAKPIAAGLPLGAFIAKEEFASAISPGQHGTTFGGGPLACRVALEFLAIVEEEKLLENVNKVGAYLHQELNALADRHHAALIFDEIQCGLGRTGTMFAFQSFGVTPDIVAIAKPIAAGLPLGAFLAKEEFASAISPGQHGTTFGGGPLACRVALEFLAIVEEEKLLENVNKVGAYLQQELKALAEKSAAAREVRGRGFIQGIELEIPARPIVDAGLAEGVLFNSTQDTVVRFLPPFLLEEKHVDKGIRVLKKLLGKKRKKAA